MSRTLNRLSCAHGTRVPSGTHQTSMESPLTFQHLSHDGANGCLAASKKSVSSICNQEVTACFTSAAATNRSPRSLRGPKIRISLCSVLPTGLATGYGATLGRLWTTLPTVPISRPVISISSDRRRSTWPAMCNRRRR
jgi:hypothetical protein